MPGEQAGPMLRYLREVMRAERPADDDKQLLQRFVGGRDETAFEMILRRHGPMVWGVCRRMLRHPQDAEDAFQATFLVLVRRAASLRDPSRLSCWLYGVASRVAAKARSQAARRHVTEPLIEDHPAPDSEDSLLSREISAVLDEEVARLPDKFRLPFVLCYLLGCTNEEAARQLGCPKGTVLSRLATARERLRGRLMRRGLAVSAGGLAGWLTARSAMADPPAALVSATLQTTASPAAATCVAVTLAQGVILSMTLQKLATIAVVLACAVALAASGFLISRAMGDGPGVGEGQRGDDKPPLGAQKPAGGGEEPADNKAVRLDRAHAELERLVNEQDRTEELWSAERTKVRRSLAEWEEALQEEDREYVRKRDRIQDVIKAEEDHRRQYRQLASELEADLAKIREAVVGEKLPPAGERLKDRLEGTLKQLQRVEGAVRTLEDDLAKIEDQHNGKLRSVRFSLINEEEKLNLLDRKQSAARARMQGEIERLEERVRLLEGTEAGVSQDTTLEKKLDRLLREVTELRLELKKSGAQSPK
jgi:RNA polymerase sigma factor (sigma-70 family)